MESEQSKPVPWCRELFLHRRNAKIEELAIKVKWILTSVCCVEERVQRIGRDCEHGVNSMRRKEASFTECSSFLQSWDDKLTIYRSKLVEFVVDLPNQGKKTRGRQTMLGVGKLASW